MASRHRRKETEQSVNGSDFGYRREIRKLKRVAERLNVIQQQVKGMKLKKVF